MLYKRGDLVWAKMKGFPPWPGIITAPPPELRKQPQKKSTLYYCIFFFGTKNYSWIETHKLQRYTKGSGLVGSKRSSALREACAAIESYIETGEGASSFNITPEIDAFDKLMKETREAEAKPMKDKMDTSKNVEESDDEDSLSDSSSGNDSMKEFGSETSIVNRSLDLTGKSLSTVDKVSEKSTLLQSSDKSTDKGTSSTEKSTSESTASPEKGITAKSTSISEKIIIKTITTPSSEKTAEKVTTRPLTEKVDCDQDSTTDENSKNTSSKEDTTPPGSLSSDTTKEFSESSSELDSKCSTPSTMPGDEYHQRSKKDSSSDTEKTPSESSKTTETKSEEFKSPVSTKSTSSSSSVKKKKVQPLGKARPFRQLTKPRAPERKTGGSQDSPSGAAAGGESTNRKRSNITTSSTSSVTPNNKNKDDKDDQGTESKKKKRQLYSDADTTTPMVHPHAHSYARRGPAAHLFDRPPNITRPDTPPFDVFRVSQTLLDKHINPSSLRFGFLGLGIMGSGMVKNLLNSGHRVIVWNRTPEKGREFAKVGAEMAVTPQDVCAAADITFSCVAGPKAAKDMVFGNCGALAEMGSSKAYVEMTNIDKETSLAIADAITARGARYLEAQIQGSKAEAEEGTLIILAAGDRTLYNECHSCFEAFGRSSYFLGDVGNAAKMNLVIQMVAGITLAGLAEGLALADRCGLQQSDILEVINMTSLKCPMIAEKGKCISDCSFPTSLPLSHMQKDLKLGLKLGDELEQPLPMAAMANEMYKHSKRLGYGDHDVSAVYIRARF